MPTVKRPAVLAATYAAVKKKIDDLPTLLLQGNQVLYRSINSASPHSSLPKPRPGGLVPKMDAQKLLVPQDGARELENRFSGPSGIPTIRSFGGLYCVMQQQALVNESTHYSGKAAAWALGGRCVLRIRLRGAVLVADLSPHTKQAMRFLRELGAATWDQMNDPNDCSVARGIGLAIAETGFLKGVAVQTVRESERSAEERGDNLVLFAAAGQAIQGAYVEQAMYFGKVAAPETFAVSQM